MSHRLVRADLQTTLVQSCTRILKPRSSILFRRGEKAFGTFFILKGMVRLDFGVDTPLAHCYGPGALVGLPATLTKSPYTMTATVTENAELGFLSSEVLDLLLRNNPALCRELLTVLGEKTLELKKVTQTMLDSGDPASGNSIVA
jgi:CRP-like cAMP-binding protein